LVVEQVVAMEALAVTLSAALVVAVEALQLVGL
jgi:hypothetical protein